MRSFTPFAVAIIGCAAAYNIDNEIYGNESAPYTVITHDGQFETRDYNSLVFVETSDSDQAFNQLFGYISGENESEMKIPMTKPVYNYWNESNTQWIMAFVMPAALTIDEVPQPDDITVDVKLTGEARYATYQYSGCTTKAMEDEGLENLKEWLATNSIAYDHD